MGVIQDSELVLYKAVAEHIKDGLTKPLKVLNAKCFSEFSKFEKQKSKFMTCETYEDLGDSSKGLKSKHGDLITLLAVQDRLDKIVKRNEQRIAYISSKLEQMGIYNDAVEKKTLQGAISAEKENVSEDSLNLNPKAKGGVTFKYFAGEILAFRDGELDFGLKENREILLSGSSEFFHEVVGTFPYSVGTIPNSYYLITQIKNKVLKECILYVASKIKTQSIAESNRDLGGLLENVVEISSFQQFVNELKNYFNVLVKQFLKEKLPDEKEAIDEQIICNESSMFLPKDIRVAGAKPQVQKQADSEKQEIVEENSEEPKEIQEENEKSKEISSEELLDLLLSDVNDHFDNKESKTDEVKSSEEKKSSVDDDIEKTLIELEELLKDVSEEDDDDKKED